VERARAHVGNLAHALKTPISVLMNEAPPSETGFPAVVRRQAEAMRRAVEHYLTRAAAAARAEALGASTPAVSVLNDLARTLGRLYASEGVQVRVEDCVAAEFRGERQDLEEMIGNLLENACKYGGGLVEARILRAPGEDPQLEVVVEDDGPGISAEQRPAALKRGLRLDETESGSGLGLAIVDDLARAYGGMLVLDESALGGLKAVLRLPAVA
jgi:signal transduction histidine kinase